MEVGIDKCAKITLGTKINSIKKFNSSHTNTQEIKESEGI
jgi:hypothetical protein